MPKGQEPLPVFDLDEVTTAPEPTKEKESAKVNSDKTAPTERRRIKYQPGKMADLLRWTERFPDGIQPPEPPALSSPKTTSDPGNNPGKARISPTKTTGESIGKNEENKKNTHSREEARSPARKQPILRYSNGGPRWTRRDPKPKAEARPSVQPPAGPSRLTVVRDSIVASTNVLNGLTDALMEELRGPRRHMNRGGRKVQERRQDQLETKGDGQHRRQSK
jgi:hypothetical protein